MSLITLTNVDYSVGGPLLLERVNLALEPNERVCIVGRNGAGKSTLLKLFAGEIRPDDGEVRVQGGVRVARLAQEVPQGTAGSVFEVVAAALGHLGDLLAEYHRLIHHLEVPGNTAALATVQSQIEAEHGWSLDLRVSQVLTRLDLPEDAEFQSLSGGMKRRVLLARALVFQPDLLLLDEPTNHLDIDAITWLEEFLRNFAGSTSIVFVTHDRSFLRALATRIVEIDRGQVTSWPGDYDNYLRRREERLHAQAQEAALFDKKLAQEEIWIRQGIKARRTRDEGRVRRLVVMRRERSQRRELGGNVRMELADTANSGKRVIEARDVSFAYGDNVMVRDFSTMILRGDRIGIIGPNGSGKTTLLKLLLGELAPTAGDIRSGSRLEVAYFDQHRVQLRDAMNALDNVAEGREFIDVGGSRKHILGYLQDFLFSPDRARAPITALSGGERNRLLLAKLFSKPSNLLVMDEPTNDLDVETLELLEELLADYPGTLLLVSHDRAFLDNVVSSTLVLEGAGRVGEYVGGYADWLRQRPEGRFDAGSNRGSRATLSRPPVQSETQAAPGPRRKLGYKLGRELEQLPARIEALEARLGELVAAMLDPAFYQRDSAAIVAANTERTSIEGELDAAYRRWEELEGER